MLTLPFFDNDGHHITVEFTPELADVFFHPFSSSLVTSEQACHSDFIQTLTWHVQRLEIGLPFIQTVVLKKIHRAGCDKYLFVSGPLKPIADGLG